jgi:hypothetical protein
MTADNNFNVEPVANLHRVVGTNPSADQKNKKRQYKQAQTGKDEQLDEQLEKELETNQENDDTGGDFHVIDYRA